VPEDSNGRGVAMNGIRQKITQYVVGTYLFGDASTLCNDTSFLGSSIMDSTGMLELIGFIEQEFQISIDDAELIPENLDSIDSLVRFIERKKP
jgi:acyl carrier protein